MADCPNHGALGRNSHYLLISNRSHAPGGASRRLFVQLDAEASSNAPHSGQSQQGVDLRVTVTLPPSTPLPSFSCPPLHSFHPLSPPSLTIHHPAVTPPPSQSLLRHSVRSAAAAARDAAPQSMHVRLPVHISASMLACHYVTRAREIGVRLSDGKHSEAKRCLLLAF